MRQLRQPENKFRAQLQSDLFLSRLADLRVSLDLMDSMITRAAARIDSLRHSNADVASYENITLHISLNNVKIAASRLAFEVVDRLIELCGLAQGYMKNTALDLERVFRDLRSATSDVPQRPVAGRQWQADSGRELGSGSDLAAS